MNTMIAKARIYDKLGDTKMAVNQYKALLALRLSIATGSQKIYPWPVGGQQLSDRCLH
jgi:hypothetical protein